MLKNIYRYATPDCNVFAWSANWLGPLSPLLLWTAVAPLHNTSSSPQQSAPRSAGGLTRCHCVFPIAGALWVDRYGWV